MTLHGIYSQGQDRKIQTVKKIHIFITELDYGREIPSLIDFGESRYTKQTHEWNCVNHFWGVYIYRVMDVLLFAASTSWMVWSLDHKKKNHRIDDLETTIVRDANERICLVTAQNDPVAGGTLRSVMRMHNLWHRATYVLVIVNGSSNDENCHQDSRDVKESNSNAIPQNKLLDELLCVVQRRSALKDYCPGKLDPLPGGVVEYGESYRENAIRELYEEMGIFIAEDGTTTTTTTTISNKSYTTPVQHSSTTLTRLFTFPYQDKHVRVWGELYECYFQGTIDDLVLQVEEVDSVELMSLQELKDRIENDAEAFMPDACHAMKLYFQRLGDLRVNRRLLRASTSLDSYCLHPRPKVVFFDCDDCLYFDGWKTANKLTAKIDEWCVQRGLPQGYAYELYKKYGTALRGLRAEGFIEDTEKAVDAFLHDVHDIPIHELLQPDQELREILLRIDPSIPKYIFTASVREHAMRCLQALGVADLFVDIIDCKKCDLETKHSRHSFETAMRVANVENPEDVLFFDDSVKNIKAARDIGWRSVLVGRVGRDCGHPISSENAELEIDHIHHVEYVLPEIFSTAESM